MKIKEYKINFINSLLPFYDEMEAESFFYLILENRHQLRRIDLALDADKEFSDAEISNWNFILEKLTDLLLRIRNSVPTKANDQNIRPLGERAATEEKHGRFC